MRFRIGPPDLSERDVKAPADPAGHHSRGDSHAADVATVLGRLEARAEGLSPEEAQRRLTRFGPNRLHQLPPVSAATILFNQFRGVVVWLLAAASGVALAMGDGLEAAAIGVVLLLNAGVGFATEFRARRAMAALVALDVPRAVVVRDGLLQRIDAVAIVPGDVLAVERGQHVPADGRVIDAADLRTDEAALTGESVPVTKSVDVLSPDTPLADRRNMIFKGTIVVAGAARVVVTATGMSTELGRIGLLTDAVRIGPTPLERRLDDLGRRLVWVAMAVGVLVGTLGIAQGTPTGLMIETAIALAVGVRRMAARHALVRRLPTVEALGSTTVICTDKTRTLTSGEMTLVRVWAADGQHDLSGATLPSGASVALRSALECAALASRRRAARDPSDAGGDPVDEALLAAAARGGLDPADLDAAAPPIGLVPFSSERKLMASFRRVNGHLVACVKGAPRQVLSLCTTAPDGEPLTTERRDALAAVNERFARDGLRVIGLARGEVAAADADALRSLTFVGYAGLADPPAPGVKETIARLRAAGLRTLMVTGDQRLTAEAVGRQLDLFEDGSAIVTAQELESMTDADLRERVAGASAFSRITPEHKLAIVRALQARGEIVAMLGDGINDAAALKQADVGVAMGRRGTDVAKEAAAIVLQDDRFETVAAAVEEGRVIFDNIRKVVFYLFSCNAAEVLVLLVAGILGLPLPILPLQLLWLNVITDTFPALALSVEPPEADVMQRPPRAPREAILSPPFLLMIAFHATLIMAAVLVAFVWVGATNPDLAGTAAFTTLALAQIFHLGNARRSAHVLTMTTATSNPLAVLAVAVTLFLQGIVLYVPPVALTLHVHPLGIGAWAIVLLLSAMPACVGQALKIAGVRWP